MTRKRSEVRTKKTARRRLAAAWPVLLVMLVGVAAAAAWQTTTTTPMPAPATAVPVPALPQSAASTPPTLPLRHVSANPAQTQTPVGSAGQRAYVDPKTGRLRPVEHDDAIAAESQTIQRRAGLARQATAAEPQEIQGPGGAVGMEVPEELMTFTVATRTPDGRVVLQHATGIKEAQAKARAGASKAAGGEVRNDR